MLNRRNISPCPWFPARTVTSPTTPANSAQPPEIASEDIMSKPPSPCIDVCKFKRGGHCIGCSMTKAQKSAFKALKKDTHREAFVELVIAQQDIMGRYSHWREAYEKKCRKKNVTLKILEEGKAA
jgi:predicted Fe-S protein YdhL (DUF1289 family)